MPKSSPKGISNQLAVLNDVKVLSHNRDLNRHGVGNSLCRFKCQRDF